MKKIISLPFMVLILMIIMMVLCTYAFIDQESKLSEQDQNIKLKQVILEEVKINLKNTEKYAIYTETEEYKEKEFRDRYGWVGENEIKFVINEE